MSVRLPLLVLLTASGWMMLACPVAADDSRQINWIGSFEAALAEAGKRKAPILLAINHEYDSRTRKEKHDANKQMARVCYRTPEVVDLSRKFVCLIAGDHRQPMDVMEETEVCATFGKISYRELRAVTASIRKKYFDGRKHIVAPQHLVLDSSGRKIDQYFLDRKPEEFVRILKESLARFHGEAPIREATVDTRAVVKALQSENGDKQKAGFKKALELLSADRNNRKVQEAAARYLRNRKGYREMLEPLNTITAAGSEGALSLLVPYLKHSNSRMRRGVLEVFARSTPYKNFLKPLNSRVKSEKSEDPLRSLVKALDRYAGEFEEAFTPLNRLASHRLVSIKVPAILAAARPGNKAVFRKLLTRTRREPDLLVRTAAILGLGTMRAKEALPVLEKVQKKEKENQALVRALDIAIAMLGEDPDNVNTAEAFDHEIERVKREAVDSGRDTENRSGEPGRNGRPGGRGGGGRGR